jgi:hypothetical protein
MRAALVGAALAVIWAGTAEAADDIENLRNQIAAAKTKHICLVGEYGRLSF